MVDSSPSSLAGIRAIIVAWNAGKWLKPCLSSLSAEGVADEQIWIVDHGTTDGSIDEVRRVSPRVNVIDHPGNRSYGEAINRAAERCKGELLLILNPDVRLHPGCLDALLRHLEQDPQVAAVGPHLVDLHGRDVTRMSRTRFFRGVAVFVVRGIFSGWMNRMTRVSSRHDPTPDVPFIEASAMLVRREAFEQVGGFDEAFTFYGEDADLCWAMRRCGYRLRHVSEAVATHAVSASFALVAETQRIAFLDGLLRTEWKRSHRRYRVMRRWLLPSLWIVSALEQIVGFRRPESTLELRQRLREEGWVKALVPPATTNVSMTVVVPTFGRPECLDRLLGSLAEQDDPDFDVVVVIQGGHSGYIEVLDRWSRRLRLRRVAIPQPSRGAAKNAGIRSSDADVVLFCDDDIIPGRDLIRTHRHAYLDPNCGATSCRVIEEGQEASDDDDRLRLTWFGRIVANGSSRRTGPAEVAACGNMSFRRHVLQACGGFDPQMRGTANLEEFDVGERLRAQGWSLWFDGETVVRHIPQEGGNAATRQQDVVAYYRALHHNLGLIIRRHRPLSTVPAALAWAALRSLKLMITSNLTLRDSMKIWLGFFDGLESYRLDQR